MKYDYIFVCWQIFIVLGKMPQEKPNKKHKDKEDLHTHTHSQIERENVGGDRRGRGTQRVWRAFSSDLLEKRQILIKQIVWRSCR